MLVLSVKTTFLIALFFALSINVAPSKAYDVATSPTLAIKTIDGRNIDLEMLHGKVVLVNFWASWCPNCRSEIPILNAVYQRYKPRGFEIISVSIDPKKKEEDVRKIASDVGYPIGMEYDVLRSNFDSPSRIPMNYLITKNGQIFRKVIQDEGDLDNAVRVLLMQP